jgi:hypothetical protein
MYDFKQLAKRRWLPPLLVLAQMVFELMAQLP